VTLASRAGRRRRIELALLASVGGLLSAAVGCRRGQGGPREPEASYAEARAVVDRHCLPCHAERTTIPAFPVAPEGVMFDTADEMRRHAERIRVRTLDKSMPLLNKSGMTDQEREVLRRWIDAGARTP
jgi:uncharacterized membrane protein